MHSRSARLASRFRDDLYLMSADIIQFPRAKAGPKDSPVVVFPGAAVPELFGAKEDDESLVAALLNGATPSIDPMAEARALASVFSDE
jgi:hypothetical protein